MSETLLEQTKSKADATRPVGAGRRVSIIGVPCGFGASIAGVDLGPAAMRVARLRQRIAQLGYEVRDLGDMRLECPETQPPPQEKTKYLKEITAACRSSPVKATLRRGTARRLGGDHSLATGSVPAFLLFAS